MLEELEKMRVFHRIQGGRPPPTAGAIARVVTLVSAAAMGVRVGRLGLAGEALLVKPGLARDTENTKGCRRRGNAVGTATATWPAS